MNERVTHGVFTLYTRVTVVCWRGVGTAAGCSTAPALGARCYRCCCRQCQAFERHRCTCSTLTSVARDMDGALSCACACGVLVRPVQAYVACGTPTAACSGSSIWWFLALWGCRYTACGNFLLLLVLAVLAPVLHALLNFDHAAAS